MKGARLATAAVFRDFRVAQIPEHLGVSETRGQSFAPVIAFRGFRWAGVRKYLRLAAALVALLCMVFALAGCGGGGAISHKVTSPWYGDLYGVETEPHDGERDIATSRAESWIHVYWPNPHYPPPKNFTVTVEKEEHPDDWGGIHTTLSVADSDPRGGSWWFQPENDFSPGTWYRIVISVPGVRRPAIAYFRTAGTRDAAVSSLATKPEPGKSYRPAGSADAQGAAETVHTITR